MSATLYAPVSEATLIGAALAGSVPAADVLAAVREDDFHDQANRRLYRTFAGLVKNGFAVDVSAVLAELNAADALKEIGGAQHLAYLLDAGAAVSSVEYHAHQLREKATTRRAAAEAAGIAEAIRAGTLSTEAAAGQLTELAATLTRTGGARVVCMDDVQPEDVRFLWFPYLPRRKLTFLEGDPGDGKTFLALTLAAALTRGEPLPGEHGRREPERVLYWTAEDGLADTLRPRLDDAGADPRRVFALSPETEAGGFLTLDCVKEIDGALDEVRPALLVIDPIQAALGAGVDAHRANEVRPRLSRLLGWAEKYDCAVLVIRHLAKAGGGKAIYRGLGSIDFAAAARSILLVGRNPEDENRRALVQTKNSVAPHGPVLEFEINDAGRLEWHRGPSTLTAAAVLSPEPSEDDRSAIEEATDFLADLLKDEALPAMEVFSKARRAGHSEKTTRRAKLQLRIASEKQATQWVWKLPTNAATEEVDHVGHVPEPIAAQGVYQHGQDGQEKVWPTSPPASLIPADLFENAGSE